MVLALLLNSAGFSSKKRNAYFQYDDSSALKLLLRQEDSRHGSRESIVSVATACLTVLYSLVPVWSLINFAFPNTGLRGFRNNYGRRLRSSRRHKKADPCPFYLLINRRFVRKSVQLSPRLI